MTGDNFRSLVKNNNQATHEGRDRQVQQTQQMVRKPSIVSEVFRCLFVLKHAGLNSSFDKQPLQLSDDLRWAFCSLMEQRRITWHRKSSERSGLFTNKCVMTGSNPRFLLRFMHLPVAVPLLPGSGCGIGKGIRRLPDRSRCLQSSNESKGQGC